MGILSGFAALSSLVLLFLLWSPSSANEGNILVTGDVLATDTQLSVDGAVFVIQDDCNLVLYNKGKGFQSGTSGHSTKCTLTLSDYGQLIIKDSQDSFIWSSQLSKHPMGEYAAVLRPDGEVRIYGPAVWSKPQLQFSEKVIAAGVDERSSDSAPNLLFSSEEVLYEGSKLVSRDYTFELTKECGLQLTKAAHNNTVVWEIPSHSGSKNCFARLNSHGQLSLLDDNNKMLWHTTAAAAADGSYVLAVKINGEATIYGPSIWTTAE